MTAGRIRPARVGIGVVLLVVGICLIVLCAAFAALYVPQCSTFSIRSADSRCRNPVLCVYGGYMLGAMGALMIGYEVFRRLRRSS